MTGDSPNQHSAARSALCPDHQRCLPLSYADSVQSEQDKTLYTPSEPNTTQLCVCIADAGMSFHPKIKKYCIKIIHFILVLYALWQLTSQLSLKCFIFSSVINIFQLWIYFLLQQNCIYIPSAFTFICKFLMQTFDLHRMFIMLCYKYFCLVNFAYLFALYFHSFC